MQNNYTNTCKALKLVYGTCLLGKTKDHLIQYSREPTYRVWRRLADKDSCNEKWGATIQKTSWSKSRWEVGCGFGSALNGAWCISRNRWPSPLPPQFGRNNVGNCQIYIYNCGWLQDGPNDDSKEENKKKKNPWGIHEYEDAIQEVYDGVKSPILVATILMILCTIHRVSNKFEYQLFAFFCLHLPGENR